LALYVIAAQEHVKALPVKSESLLKVLLFGIALFNAADYYMTTLTLNMGYRELNPLIDIIVHTPYFALLKIVVIPALLYFVWLQRYRIGARILVYAWGAFLPYFFLMIYFKLIFWVWLV